MDSFNYKYMDSLFMDEYKAMDRLELYSDRELQVVVKENATVLPFRIVDGEKKAGVIDEKGEYLPISSFEALSPVDSWGGSYHLDEPPEFVPETVVYFGRFWKHWGHFLMDMVSRLWYILENPHSYKLVCDTEDEIAGVYLEFLNFLGISGEQILRINKPTQFEKVIIPECSHKPGISCHIKFKAIFDSVADNVLKDMEDKGGYKGKSIYFTRRGLSRRVPFEVGEKEVEELFKQSGFLVISPEKYSLSEQILMLRQAEKIACVSGTLPHNMIFAKDGTEIIIIRKTNKPNYRQVGVNEIRDLKVTNIDAHISLKAVGPAGPFIIDVNNNVKKYFSDNYGKYQYQNIRQWFRRKLKLIWYIPVYVLRNRKEREVPLFDGEGFSTTLTAKKELFDFYIKRI